MMQAVFTNNYRVSFVEKSASEVGDGTAWPMEATLDQIAEIFFRVKDAWFTDGYFQADLSDSPNFYRYDIVGGVPAGAKSSSLKVRGLTVPSTAVPAMGDAYFGEEYAGYGSPGNFRDMLDDERGLWVPLLDGHCPTAFELICYSEGASNDIEDNSDPAIDGAFMLLHISDQVAWVDANNSGDPFDPLNPKFINLNFTASTADTLGTIDSNSATFSPYAQSAGIDLNFELSTSTLSVPLYCLSGTYESVSGSDFVMTAQEWWPYAKGSPAAPVWDSETGVKL